MVGLRDKKLKVNRVKNNNFFNNLSLYRVTKPATEFRSVPTASSKRIFRTILGKFLQIRVKKAPESIYYFICRSKHLKVN
jgi:hypothetical protein